MEGFCDTVCRLTTNPAIVNVIPRSSYPLSKIYLSFLNAYLLCTKYIMNFMNSYPCIRSWEVHTFSFRPPPECPDPCRTTLKSSSNYFIKMVRKNLEPVNYLKVYLKVAFAECSDKEKLSNPAESNGDRSYFQNFKATRKTAEYGSCRDSI